MLSKSSLLMRLKPSAIAPRPIPSAAQSPLGVSAARTILQFGERGIFLKSVASDDRVEGTDVVSEFGIGHVEHGSVSDCRTVRMVRKNNEFRVGIDKFRDQLWTPNSIDLCLFTRDPLHAIASCGLNDTTAIQTLATESSECQD